MDYIDKTSFNLSNKLKAPYLDVRCVYRQTLQRKRGLSLYKRKKEQAAYVAGRKYCPRDIEYQGRGESHTDGNSKARREMDRKAHKRS